MEDDVDETWRVIPGFPKYEITSDGDVRNRISGKILPEHLNEKTGSWYYSLHKKTGKKTSRSMWSLVYLAWPELLREWRPIPGHPNYLVHPDGRVMGTIRYQELPKNRLGAYRLELGDGRRCIWYFKSLEAEGITFDNFYEEAA